MLLLQNNPFRHRRIHRAALMLMRAGYASGVSVTLVFNLPVAMGDFVAGAVVVDDGPGGRSYIGIDAEAVDPFSVRVGLLYIAPAAGTRILLTSAGGILAGDQVWGGVDQLALPFP